MLYEYYISGREARTILAHMVEIAITIFIHGHKSKAIYAKTHQISNRVVCPTAFLGCVVEYIGDPEVSSIHERDTLEAKRQGKSI